MSFESKLRVAYELGNGRGYDESNLSVAVQPCPYPEESQEADWYYMGYRDGANEYYSQHYESPPDDDYNPDLDDEYEPKV